MALEEPIQVLVERERSRRWISSAAIAAWVQAGITLLIVLFAVRQGPFFEDLGWWTYIDVAVVAGLGAGMLVMPRVAGVALIGLLALSTLKKLVVYGEPSGLLGAGIFGYFYVQGLRGGFALFRLGRSNGGTDTVGHPQAGPSV